MTSEERARAKAEEWGYTLERSPETDPNRWAYGVYKLTEDDDVVVIEGLMLDHFDIVLDGWTTKKVAEVASKKPELDEHHRALARQSIREWENIKSMATKPAKEGKPIPARLSHES